MADDPGPETGRRTGSRPRRKLNVSLIKQVIVFIVGGITALVSGLTGLGAQPAFGPMLTWMLGFSAEKALASATRYACVAAFATVIGALFRHATPTFFILKGLSLFLGAFIGALISAPLSQRMQTLGWKRFSQTIGVGIALLVLMSTARLGRFDTAHLTQWNASWNLLEFGLLVGAVSQILALPSGLLMVPVLFYFGAFTASEAITLTLFVVALAALLPSITYSRRGMVDTAYSGATLAAALTGGLAAGLLLPPVSPIDPNAQQIAHKIYLEASAVIGMFLCARQLSLLSRQAGAVQTGPDRDRLK